MIDLTALASLRAVAAEGSVVGAADALGFTPSAVSSRSSASSARPAWPCSNGSGAA